PDFIQTAIKISSLTDEFPSHSGRCTCYNCYFHNERLISFSGYCVSFSSFCESAASVLSSGLRRSFRYAWPFPAGRQLYGFHGCASDGSDIWDHSQQDPFVLHV